MFSYSIEGAKFTLVEIAKANNAHSYYYLKYLLDALSIQNITKGKSFLDDCVPWSNAYRSYEISGKAVGHAVLCAPVPIGEAESSAEERLLCITVASENISHYKKEYLFCTVI